MKPVHVQLDTYIDFDVENLATFNDDKNPKFKVGDNMRISNYKNIFTKGCTANWSREVCVV